ncbi:hypothetical protein F5Y18DRAFT_335233 [Xylariaceae sp. FL1019]|nr:hypothetical protein F5Y18DRAFT_335233 [Xylariaceae sp. FL1019]
MIQGRSDNAWALQALRHTLQTTRFPPSLLSDFTASSEANDGFPLDPERLAYVRELIKFLLEGRDIVAAYNIALLLVLLMFSISHCYQKIALQRKIRAIEGGLNGWDAEPHNKVLDDTGNGTGSSSSSTLDGATSPGSSVGQKVDVNLDLERQPLLKNRDDRLHPAQASTSTVSAIVRSWLMYQPPAIPIVNRQLPSNLTSLFVAAWVGLNIFLHLYRMPFELKYFFVFADRSGYVFIVNLPLLYLLAAKNQPLKFLTGRSYEALNIFHRRVGEFMCFEAVVHFVGMLIWRVCISPDWLKGGDFRAYITHPLILLGIGAFVSYELLYFTSLASFRERWYELFLASHVMLQIAALVFLWLHFHTSRPYVYASLVIFFVDRIVWRIGLKSATVQADIEILEDGETVLLSAAWDRPRGKSALWSFRQNALFGWHPADHIFVSVPELGGSNALRAHPFTIASAAPSGGDTRISLDLLIRTYTGFTSELLEYARAHSSIRVRMDGPYGSTDPLDMIRASRSTILIAGGSGIAVVLPLICHLARTQHGKRKMHLLWIIHSGSQRSWVPKEKLDELRRLGVHVTIPEPTVEAGRPDVAAYVSDIVSGSQTETGVVVSGPDGLNRRARNICAEEIRRGSNIDLRVEKFGW